MIEPGNLLAQRFLVERALGAGGMGEVFLVRHANLGERFALKVLRRSGANDTQAIARFQREARAAAGLRCEHTVRVTDYGFLDDGAPFFVMEYIDGPSLASRLRREGPMAPTDATRAALHACAALAEAHALGIVHRDIKPANLLLTARSDGSPLIKLADFGIARLLINAESLTETHTSLGSPAYMAPEQIRDARSADTRSDIWSLGVTLHELLAGQTPFHAFTAPGVLSRVLTEEPAPLSSLCPALPAGLEAVVARCLEKDAARRFPSILDLADALAPFVPEPDEGARVRRIWAFTLRPAPEREPPRPHDLAACQITDAPTSLTQAPELAPPVASVAVVPGLSAELPRSAPRRPWKLVAGLAFASLLAGGLSSPSLRRMITFDPLPTASSMPVAVSSGPVASVVPASADGPPTPAALSGPALPAASPLPVSPLPAPEASPLVSVVVLAVPGPSVVSSASVAGKPSPPVSKPLSPPASKPTPPPTPKPAPPPLLGEFGSRQ